VWTLPKNVSHLQNAPFDWLGVGGLILLAGGFYAVSGLAGRQPVIALVGLAVIGLVLWGWLHLEKRQSAPLFEASLLKGEKVATPLLTSFLSFIAAYAFVLLAPLYLQLVVHLDSRITGLVLMTGPLAALVANPLAGVLVDHFGQATLMRIGMVIMLIAQLGLIALSGVGEPWWVIIWSVISVIGTALFTTAANTRIMTGVTAAHRGAIGALNSLAREVGMMLGVSVASGIYYGVLSQTAGKMVTNALHQSRAELILAQRGAYLVASILLGVALWQLRRRNR
jgi:predicted MFS family arabinose efflux permease